VGRLSFLCEKKAAQALVAGFSLDIPPTREFLISRLLRDASFGTLIEDFAQLRNETIPFDYRILLDDGRIIQAHLFILASRCSFFRAESLRTWMSEAQSPSCIFAGVPFPVFQFLLEFIYTDSIPSLSPQQSIPIVAQILREDLANYFGFSTEYLVHHCIKIMTNIPKPNKGPLYYLDSIRNRLPA